MSPSRETAQEVLAARKPTDEEIDVFGLTHVGSVRSSNQDHFLICSLRRQVQILRTSLPDGTRWPAAERLAFLAMVADGVGGSSQGEEASRLAVEGITDYVTQSMKAYYTADASAAEDFAQALQDAAMQTHERVVERAKADPGGRNMATTLTLFLGVWPRAYLLQIGDSRCYLMRDGVLTQITRDQTMAQELVDQGVLTRADAPAHALGPRALERHRRAPDRAGRDPVRERMEPGDPALQRRAHQARVRRAHRRAPPGHDLRAASLRAAAGRRARGRRQ